MWADQNPRMKEHYEKLAVKLRTQKSIIKVEPETFTTIQDPDDTYSKWKDSEWDNSSYKLL